MSKSKLEKIEDLRERLSETEREIEYSGKVRWSNRRRECGRVKMGDRQELMSK